jgi:hypothetical protein
VITTFGRAQRVGESTTLQDPISETLRPDERQRYDYPQVRVVGPGFYWKLPWQRVHKVSIATVTVSIAYDPEDGSANHGGRLLEAVTKDQLNTGLSGQLRFTVAERNLYAYLFGVKNPVAHVMGYFISSRHPPRRNRCPRRRGWTPPCKASPSTICAKTCVISATAWTISARRPRRATASTSTQR